MTYRYRVVLRPQAQLYFRGRPRPSLSAETVAHSIADAVVYEQGQTSGGDQLLVVGLARSTHEQALNELFALAQQFGYAWVEAAISEWASEAASGTVIGLLGAGAVGSKSNNDLVTLGAAVVGGLAGRAIGAQIEHEKIIFQVDRQWPSGWALTAVAPNDGGAEVGRWSLT